MNTNNNKVLVTGGSGGLGQELIPRLQKAGYTVRVTSRRPAPAGKTADLEWAQVDLLTGEGLDEAMKDVHTVIHAASSPLKDAYTVEVEGTKRLLEAAEKAGIQHLLYISIVGVDKIPYSYYKAKLAAEKVIESSALPWSILRATQFYTLLDMVLEPLTKLPLVSFVPLNFRIQPIETGEVADRMVQSVKDGPGGRLADIAGPEVRLSGELAKMWLKARGRRRLLLPLPLFGQTANGFKQGLNTAPANKYGRMTFAEWLEQRFR